MSLDTWTFAPSGSFTDVIPIGDYTYRESVDSYTGTLGDNPQAVRKFFVDWDMKSLFIDDLLGWSVQSGSGLQRVLPDEHPDYSYFFATDCSVKPLGVPNTSGTRSSKWDVAEITVTYKPLPYAVRADKDITTELDRFVSRETQGSAEYLTANNTGVKWVKDQQSLQFSPGIAQPNLVQVMTWHSVPARIDPADYNSEFKIPNESLVLPLMGCTNDATFDGRAPGTVLLENIGSRMVMPKLDNGYYMWDIIYSFRIRDYGPSLDEPGQRAGVNYIYDLRDSTYSLITTDGTLTGGRIYPSANFGLLFQLPT